MLRHMSSKEIDELGLTFEISSSHNEDDDVIMEGGGMRKSSRRRSIIELIPGGSRINVTKQNVIRYVHLVAHRRLNVDSAKQTLSFLHGFRDLIPAAWVRLFSPYELQRLISGDDTIKGFDVSGEYHCTSVIVLDKKKCNHIILNSNESILYIFNIHYYTRTTTTVLLYSYCRSERGNAVCRRLSSFATYNAMVLGDH